MSTKGRAAPAHPGPFGRVNGPVNPLVCWALYLLAFSLPLEAPDRLAFEVTALTGAGFVICTALDPRACYSRAPWAAGWFALSVLIFLVAFLTQGASYPGGLYLYEVQVQSLRLIVMILLLWACSNLLGHEKIYRAALWALILGCTVRAALPLLGLARSVSMKGAERVAALGQNPNQSAQVLALGLIALIGLTYVQPAKTRRVRMLALGGAALIAVGIMQTGSRGGLVTAVLGALVFLGRGHTLRARIRSLAVGVLMLGGLGYLALRSETMLARVEKTVEYGHMSGRDVIWPTALGMLQDKPFFGWGTAVNKYELAARLKDAVHNRRDTHNLLLELLTASGVFGTLPFLVGVWLCLRGAWRARAGPRGAVPLALMLAMLAGNMTQNRLTWAVLWLVLALGPASENIVARLTRVAPPPQPSRSLPAPATGLASPRA